jgi:formate/nitrite transporter
LGILAGVFIGLGAAASSTAAHSLGDTGLIRLVSGLVFPVGLCLVVLLGAELFTGKVLMLNAVADKKISFRRMLRNWGLVYAGNLLGALILAAALAFGGQLDIGGGDLAVYTAKVAAAKAGLPFLNALILGIFCNLLVCAAIYLAIAAKTVMGKIVAIFVPIAAFVIAGFEHSVANMYYIPAGIFANLNPAYTNLIADTSINTAVLNFGDFFLNNIIPVTIGNIIGGAAIGLTLYLCNKNRKKIIPIR